MLQGSGTSISRGPSPIPLTSTLSYYYSYYPILFSLVLCCREVVHRLAGDHLLSPSHLPSHTITHTVLSYSLLCCVAGKEVHRSAGEIAMEGEMDREKRIREVSPLSPMLYIPPYFYSMDTSLFPLNECTH